MRREGKYRTRKVKLVKVRGNKSSRCRSTELRLLLPPIPQKPLSTPPSLFLETAAEAFVTQTFAYVLMLMALQSVGHTDPGRDKQKQ